MKEKLYYSEGKKLMLIHGETIIITNMSSPSTRRGILLIFSTTTPSFFSNLHGQCLAYYSSHSICIQLLLIYHSNIHQFPWWGGEYENRPLSPTTLQTFMLYGSIALHNNFAFKILSCYIAHHKTKNAIRNPQ